MDEVCFEFMREMRNGYILVKKPERNKERGTSRRRWEVKKSDFKYDIFDSFHTFSNSPLINHTNIITLHK
jgi:hypothetical protein